MAKVKTRIVACDVDGVEEVYETNVVEIDRADEVEGVALAQVHIQMNVAALESMGKTVICKEILWDD